MAGAEAGHHNSSSSATIHVPSTVEDAAADALQHRQSGCNYMHYYINYVHNLFIVCIKEIIYIILIILIMCLTQDGCNRLALR